MEIVLNKTSFLDVPIQVEPMHGVTFSNENKGHKFVVSCMRGGELLTLTGTVTARFMRANNTTILIAGNDYTGIVDGKAVVTLPQDCYNVPGRFQMAIFLTADGATSCIYACVGSVQRTQNGDLIDSGEAVPSLEELLAQIDACEQATADATAAANAVPGLVTETFATNKAYTAGSYVYYNGSLYKFTADHAAGAWTGSDATAVKLANDVGMIKNAFLPLKVYEFIDPNEFRTFVSDHAINAQINNGKFESINSRICAPYVFRCKNTIKICANVISDVNCFVWVNTYSGPTLDETITGSWQGPGNYVTIEHDTYFAFQVRKSGSGTAISPSEMSDAITVAMVDYHMVTDKTLLLENVPADAKTTGQQISGNTSNITNNTTEIGNLKNYTVNNLSKTFDVYELDNAEAIYQFFEDNIILGAFNDYGEVDTTSTIRAVIPIVFKTKNQFKLSMTGSYQFNRNVIENQIVPYSSRTVSGWQTTLIFNPDTYYNLTFRNGSGGATVVLADLMNAINITVTDYTVTERFAVAMANNYHPIKSVAHRGRMNVAPENTMPAFIAAAKAGFKYIETDVLFTQNGTPVCIHDSTIDRTSNGTGAVSSMTYNQLLSYDFGSWFGSQFAGTKIPTFEEYIAFCHNSGTIPIIELKTDKPVMTNAQIDQLIAIVKKYGLEGVAYWSSFGNGFLEYIYTNHPTYHLLYGIGWKSDEVSIAYIKERYPTAIAQFASAPTSERLSLYQAENIPVCVWTPSETEAIFALDPYISMVFNNLYHAGATMLMNAVK